MKTWDMQIRKGGRDEQGREDKLAVNRACTAGQEPRAVQICFPEAPSSVPGTPSWPIRWEGEEEKNDRADSVYPQPAVVG